MPSNRKARTLKPKDKKRNVSNYEKNIKATGKSKMVSDAKKRATKAVSNLKKKRANKIVNSIPGNAPKTAAKPARTRTKPKDTNKKATATKSTSTKMSKKNPSESRNTPNQAKAKGYNVSVGQKAAENVRKRAKAKTAATKKAATKRKGAAKRKKRDAAYSNYERLVG